MCKISFSILARVTKNPHGQISNAFVLTQEYAQKHAETQTRVHSQTLISKQAESVVSFFVHLKMRERDERERERERERDEEREIERMTQAIREGKNEDDTSHQRGG